MENENLAETIPMEDPITESAAEPDAVSLPEDTEEGEAQADPSPTADTSLPETPAEAPFLSVQFNHENRDMNREEAVAFAQKGLLYEKISPIYHKLDYLAAQQNTTVRALVDDLLSTAENAYRQRLTEKLGTDAQMVEELMALYHSRNKEKYDRLLADRAESETRAVQAAQAEKQRSKQAQFLALQREFPEIGDITELPDEVVQTAAEQGTDLLAAYLLHQHRQERKIAAAKMRAAEQTKRSTGSVHSAEHTEAAAVDAFIRGVRTMKY